MTYLDIAYYYWHMLSECIGHEYNVCKVQKDVTSPVSL
jgi:hypothetical protein